jgi:hypothetical protein
LTLSKAVKNTEMYSKQKKILFVGLERHISIVRDCHHYIWYVFNHGKKNNQTVQVEKLLVYWISK